MRRSRRGVRDKRLVVAYEAGGDGFWLARWLRARGEERGRIRVQPARNGMALGASLREWDLNWLARHAFWAALTLIAPPRAREGRGGADRRAYVADLFFCCRW